MKNLTLENLVICGFKTIKEPAAIEFAAGLNAVLVSTDYAIPCGHWDLFDAIRWLFGLQMQHGRKIIFDENIDVAQAVAVIGEDRKEIVISRRIFKNGKDEQLIESEPNAVFRLKEFLVEEDPNTLTFGKTKIVATNDKKFAMQADKMIGITTNETGKISKVLVLPKKEN
ncbi:MAG: hypothetical protein PUF61_09440 [Spirochaetales bacterium]|nr:hypothetical protein [Spirochaetales bacterium]